MRITLLLVVLAPIVLSAAERLSVASPDGTIAVELLAGGGGLRYRIQVDGAEVLAPSALGLVADGVDLGAGAELGEPLQTVIDERFAMRGGQAEARHHARSATVPVTAGGQGFTLDLRVADDGVAVRLRLPAKPGRAITADRSTWRLAGDPVVWAAPLSSCYEETYATVKPGDLASGTWGMPLTARVGTVYLGITEAVLRDYGDLALKGAADGSLSGVLHADPKGWTTDEAVTQPWRVTIIGRDLTALVNSTLVLALNPPPAPELAKAEWIRPGRATWQWMAIGAPKHDDQAQWIAWTQDLGFEYYLVDDGWKRWPDAWASLAKVCADAKTVGVQVWLWVHSNEVKVAVERDAYFAKAAAAGVAGVKIDFMPRTSRWWSTWYYDTAASAAAHRLMIDFHGATKPTGMERTWPNELSREGIRGHEWHMTRYKRRLAPGHDTILPFTRGLAGHGDYTPTVFEAKELQGNSWAHELAQMITNTSPFLCTGGHPRDYLANSARDVLMAIPATWDETRILPGSEPGAYVAMARRRGEQWFVGVINGAQDVKLDLPLGFLAAGSWKATILGDVAGKDDAWDRQELVVTAADAITRPCRPCGGLVVRLQR